MDKAGSSDDPTEQSEVDRDLGDRIDTKGLGGILNATA